MKRDALPGWWAAGEDALPVTRAALRNGAWRSVTSGRLRFPAGRVATWLAASFLALWCLVGVLGAWLAPGDAAVDTIARLRPPSAVHLLGTDQFGRDVLARLLAGARYALYGVTVSTVVAAACGSMLGILAGSRGGLADTLIARLIDLWLALPAMLFAIAIVGAFGPSYANAVLAIGVMRIPAFARVARAAALSVRGAEYVQAARAAGARERRVVWRHVLPNVAGPLIALAGVRASTALLAGSALSFVGLGAAIGEPEWGAMVAAGRSYVESAWWIATFPCLALIAVALALQLAGDALRDRLDPAAR